MCYIGGMNAIGENWDCPTCGRKMTPHGDCYSCEKKERNQAEAEGRIKRAKNIVVGDIVGAPFGHIKIDSFPVHTVEHTSKGKVIINKGRGHCFEETFWGEQWVDIVGKVEDHA